MKTLAEQFDKARGSHKASAFLAKHPHWWDGNQVSFSDLSRIIPSGILRHLSSKEETSAVARFCRRHGYSANTVRQNTQLMGDAVREWRLDFLV